MAKMTFFSVPVVVLVVVFLLSMSFTHPADASEGDLTGLELGKWSRDGQCTGSMEECEESEIRRRKLVLSLTFISIEALNANRVPCSYRGLSYYNCYPDAPANTYQRGCDTISRCSRY
ncbi:hypothetical protein vseg_010512 [Gypsophila vaccaria]